MTLSKQQIAKAAIKFESTWMDGGRILSASSFSKEESEQPLHLECAASTPTGMQEFKVVFGEELWALVPEQTHTLTNLPLAIKSIVACQYNKAYVFKIYHVNDYNMHYQHEHWCNANLELIHTVVLIGLKDQSKTHRSVYSNLLEDKLKQRAAWGEWETDSH